MKTKRDAIIEILESDYNIDNIENVGDIADAILALDEQKEIDPYSEFTPELIKDMATKFADKRKEIHKDLTDWEGMQIFTAYNSGLCDGYELGKQPIEQKESKKKRPIEEIAYTVDARTRENISHSESKKESKFDITGKIADLQGLKCVYIGYDGVMYDTKEEAEESWKESKSAKEILRKHLDSLESIELVATNEWFLKFKEGIYNAMEECAQINLREELKDAFWAGMNVAVGHKFIFGADKLFDEYLKSKQL